MKPFPCYAPLLAAVLTSFFLAELRGDDFSDQLDRLNKTSLETLSPPHMRAAYQQLIEQHPDHPQRAVAMFRLAHLYQIADPGKGETPDNEQCLSWLRESRQAAEPGSEIWLEATFHLAGHLPLSEIEARKSLQKEVLAKTSDPVATSRAYYNLQVLAVREKDYPEAERICHMLQAWMPDEAKQPKTMREKGKFFQGIQASASSLMIAYSEMFDLPTATRRAKIEAFFQQYQERQYMQRARDDALEHLDQLIYVPTPIL